MAVVLLPPGLSATVPLSGVSKGLGLATAGLPAIASLATCSGDCSSLSAQARETGRARLGRGPLLVEARGATKTPRAGTRASASRFLEVVASKPKMRKRRRGGKGDDEGSGDDGSDGGSFGGGGWKGGSFNGGFGDYGGYSGGEFFFNWLMYEGSWIWPAFVAASVLHSLGYCLLSTEDTSRRSRLRHRVASSFV